MKKFILPLTALLVASSCVRLMPDFHMHRECGYAHDSTHQEEGGNSDGGRGEAPGEPPAPAADTTIWITAVSVPDSYDWRKDSVYYLSGGEIIVLKDLTPTSKVQYGHNQRVSAATDLHHLVGGDLYTEYCTAGTTYLKRNGETVCTYEGSEVLKGLIVKDGDLYTLGANRSGRGFALRKNGEILYSEQEGSVWGSLDDSSFPASGALYEAGGNMVFFFSKSTASGQVWFSADTKGGHSLSLPDGVGWIYDIKSVNGGINYLYRDTEGAVKLFSGGKTQEIQPKKGVAPKSCRILLSEGSDGKSVWIESAGGGCSIWTAGVADIFSRERCDYLYSNGKSSIGVRVSESGAVEVCYGRLKDTAVPGRYYFFNSHCAAMCGDHLAMVLTPMEKGGKPVLWMDGKTTEIDVEGYLTGIYVEINPTN